MLTQNISAYLCVPLRLLLFTRHLPQSRRGTQRYAEKISNIVTTPRSPFVIAAPRLSDCRFLAKLHIEKLTSQATYPTLAPDENLDEASRTTSVFKTDQE